MKRDEKARKRIMDAARELFHEYGPVKATLRDVAHQAGVSKSLIYYYFKDKNEIFREIVIDMDRTFMAEVRTRVMQESTAADRVRVFLTGRFRYLMKAAARRKISLERSLEYYPLFHSMMDLFLDGETSLLQEIIDFGNDRDEFHVADPYAWSRQTAMLLLAMDYQIFIRNNDMDNVMDMDAWEAVVNTIIRGLTCGD